MAAKINGFSLAYTAAGAVVLWSGIKGEKLSDTFRGLLSGQAPNSNQEPITGSPASGGSDSSAAAGTSAATVPAPVGGKGGASAANMAVGELMAASYGWTGNDWLCLKTGWQEESNWNQFAANVPSDPYNHAYGIPQANPGTKMASAGSDWKTNPVTQIRWGLGYIKATYGSPSRVPGWTPNGPAAGYVGY